jgi:hypothetical protein
LLFPAQELRRFDPQGTCGGDEACHRCNHEEEERAGSKGNGINRRNLKKETAEQALRGPGAEQSDASTDHGRLQTLPKHQRDCVGPARPQGDADRKLLLPLRDDDLDNAVNADHGQDQSSYREGRKQESREASVSDLALYQFIKGLHLGQGDVAVQSM